MDVGALEHLSLELDAFHNSDRCRPLHIFCVFPKIKPEELPKAADEVGAEAIIEKLGDKVFKLEIMSPKRRQSAYGYLLDSGIFWNVLIKTIESPQVAEHIAILWLNKMRPVIARAYIKSSDLLGIMDSLSQTKGATLGLRDYILRAYDSPDSMKRWPRDRPYSRFELESDLKREKKLLAGLNFLFTGNSTRFNVRIQTNGQFAFYEGGEHCFTDFNRLVLSRFNEIALENYRIFSNKQRKKVSQDMVEISRITLNPMKQLTARDFSILSCHIARGYSTAVLHSGNPWLMLSALDRADGSSFDIFGYSPEIQIIPSNKASPESLMRLIHYFFEIYPLMRITQETV